MENRLLLLLLTASVILALNRTVAAVCREDVLKEWQNIFNGITHEKLERKKTTCLFGVFQK